jgi:hypothetical protein
MGREGRGAKPERGRRLTAAAYLGGLRFEVLFARLLALIAAGHFGGLGGLDRTGLDWTGLDWLEWAGWKRRMKREWRLEKGVLVYQNGARKAVVMDGSFGGGKRRGLGYGVASGFIYVTMATGIPHQPLERTI